MLNLRKVLGAKPKEHVQVELEPLLTPWGERLDVDRVWEEHPDPSLERSQYFVLNGRWSCAFVASGHDPAGDVLEAVRMAQRPDEEEYDRHIVVPFSPESTLSGVGRQLQPDELLWYRRVFSASPLDAGQRYLIHFQAVDYACSVWVNGHYAGEHAGGYIPFTVDATGFLREGQNDLEVCVADPSEFGGHVRGKQRFDRGDIWYTAQSGIWQTVWAEVVPDDHVVSLRIEADAQTGILVVGVQASRSAHAAETHLKVFDGQGSLVAQARQADSVVGVHVDAPRLWSPDDPYLYHLEITYGRDTVKSYCAFRSIEMGNDAAGHPCVLLNGQPLFIKGVLDQAYWSDGLMTAPCDEALVHDIQAMREAGFNLMRKHIKIENARWYYHCDRLGMLVLQDMVQGGDPEIHTWDWSYKPTLFKVSWNHFRDDSRANQLKLGAGDAAYRSEWSATCCETVRMLANHPSIIGWSLFNEGWGQFDARSACAMVRKLDPTRVIDAVSGWYDQGCGDFSSVHNYFRTLKVWPCRRGRAFFVSEFGGFSHRVEGHSSLPMCYGYEVYDDIEEWRQNVRSLLRHMDSLQSKGLAGYVYTQVSDIEEEMNGILTYDRRVNKLVERES